MPGIKNCEVEIKEILIKKLRADSRGGRHRALQILAGEVESPRSNPQICYILHISDVKSFQKIKESSICGQ